MKLKLSSWFFEAQKTLNLGLQFLFLTAQIQKGASHRSQPVLFTLHCSSYVSQTPLRQSSCGESWKGKPALLVGFWYFVWQARKWVGLVPSRTSASRQQWLVTVDLSKWVAKRRSRCSLVLPFRVSHYASPEHYQLPGLLKCLRWMRTLVALARWESTWKLIRVSAWEKENSSAHLISCFDFYPFDDILTGKWHLNFSQSEQNCIMRIAYALGGNQRDLHGFRMWLMMTMTMMLMMMVRDGHEKEDDKDVDGDDDNIFRRIWTNFACKVMARAHQAPPSPNPSVPCG